MTDTAVVETHSTVPAIPVDDDSMVGMEDFDDDDIVMPTIKIEHREGVFVDSLSNQKIPVLDCVVLGLVKGRIMWDKEVRENEPPLCRSLDFETGRPGKEFPWTTSGFAQDPAATVDDPQTVDCGSCRPSRTRLPPPVLRAARWS